METYLSSFIIYVPLKGGLKENLGFKINVFIFLTNNPPAVAAVLLSKCLLE